MRIVFVGDIMPGGVLPYQNDYVTSEVKNLLYHADLRVGTLECAIGDNLPFDKTKMKLAQGKNIVYAREKDFEKVKELRFDVVTLANNHIFDLGAEGLANTIRILDENGICHCGGGMNLQEASQACIIELEGKSFAFIGCCFEGIPPRTIEKATETHAGIFQTNEAGICKLIQEVKRNADYVIVLPHWGVEYSYVPPRRCYNIARGMVDAGADAIIGSHTHIMNPRIIFKGKPVYFSLGNFLFPDFCLQVPRPITYPETKKEVYRMPVIKNYPSKIEEPSRVVWKKPSRRGVIATIAFGENDDLLSETNFTLLDGANVLTLLRGEKHTIESIRMWWYGVCLKSRLYHVLRKAYFSKYNLLRRAFNNAFC